MGVLDAPQWLLPAYIRSVKAVGASAPAPQLQAAGERLIAMWLTPDRRFHNLKHAIDMLARVDELADESHNPDLMRLAAWYHGCVFSSATEETYRRNGGENEIESAAYAAQDLAALGIPEKITERVCALIINLKRHNLPREDIDAMALNDADLGTLAINPQQYRKYRALVREEYAHIPDEYYFPARLAIVSKLLARESLFSSPLGERWELPARQNLESEQSRLKDTIAKLSHLNTTATPEVAMPPASADGAFPAQLATPVAQAPASSAATPAGASASKTLHTPASPDAAPTASAVSSPKTQTSLTHTTSLESCGEDLDQLLNARRPLTSQATDAEKPAAADRESVAASERIKMAEKLRSKAEQAKALREARTEEFPTAN